MHVSRREFIRAGSVFAVTAGVSLGFANLALGEERLRTPEAATGSAIPYEAQRDALFHMTRATFAQYLNTIFVIDPGYTFPIEAKLIEVTDLRSAADKKKNAPGKECFVLRFEASGDKAVTQNTYQVRHDALGSFDLFVVPSKSDRGEVFFEAVINRMVP